MCRKQFLGSRSSIEKKLFEIIDSDEKYVYQELRKGLLGILKARNKKSIERVLAYLKKNGNKN